MKKHPYPVINIGSVLLLMTFIVLCLATFSALSLSSSVSEYQYSQKLAKHNQDYYAACNKANEMLQSIDDILKAAYKGSQSDYYAAAERELESLDQVTADFSKKPPTVTCRIAINRTQFLQVGLTLNPPSQIQEGYYRITSWQESPASQWKGDDSLTLIK